MLSSMTAGKTHAGIVSRDRDRCARSAPRRAGVELEPRADQVKVRRPWILVRDEQVVVMPIRRADIRREVHRAITHLNARCASGGLSRRKLVRRPDDPDLRDGLTGDGEEDGSDSGL